jgi:hypothetical protein
LSLARRIGPAIAAAVAVLLLAAAPGAVADVYDDNPAAASRGLGDIWLFARAGDGATLERHWTGTAWSDWTSLGGVSTSGPAAAAYNGQIHVFIRGTDGAVYTNYLSSGGSWSGWASLGGYATSAPAVALRRGPLNYLDLAIRGNDNTIYFRSYVPAAGWSPWSSLGGNLTSAPALASQADGIVNVWARGTDSAVYQKSWNGSAWTEWGSLAGGIYGAPAAISRAPGYVNLYVRGSGNQSFADSWSGNWSGWQVLDPTPIDSAPAPFSDDPSRESVAVRRGANLLLKSWSAGTGWGPWTDLGPVAVPVPVTPAPPAQDGEVFLEAGLTCTPPGGRVRVHITVRKQKGKAKARVSRIVFFTKGKGRRVAIDHRAPFVAHLKVNEPAGKSGRVYARVYFRRSKHGKLHHKTVSRRFVVCR